ncbi:MAG: hypothetical protein EBQ96_00270 [Proteobacteria bacterium]|nr:hypothetical protein [Pseudomonadota bacterium]
MEIFILSLKIFALVLLLVAAFEDIRHLRIRNEFCAAVAVLFLPILFTSEWDVAKLHLISALIVFVVTAIFFFFRMFGGGDAKILAALALWFTPAQLPGFLIVMTLAGGVLGVIAIVLKKSGVLPKLEASAPKIFGPSDGWLASLSRGETVVPYGVAITLAAALTFF